MRGSGAEAARGFRRPGVHVESAHISGPHAAESLAVGSIGEVEALFHRLDGSTISLLVASHNDEDKCIVGGGGERFVVSLQKPLERHWYLINAKATNPGELYSILLGGQRGDVRIAQVVDAACALRALRYYAEMGIPDPDLLWDASRA